MKQYPSIPGSRDKGVKLGEPCLAFYKYDGSNLRWEWNKKRGWYKFGTRHRLFGADEAPYNQAIPIFMNSVAPRLEQILLKEYKGAQELIAYTEFFGQSSFAGNHDLKEEKELRLIDVSVHRRGFIEPRAFWKLFRAEPWCAQMVYDGNLNREMIEEWRNDQNSLNEGVVCKGVNNRGQIWMVKVKTNRYLDRLKSRYGHDWERYAE